MVKIIWSQRAVVDLDGIADYIALDKPEAASDLVARIRSRVVVLADFPEMGPRIPEMLRRSQFRQLVEPPCRIFYRYELKTKTIYILGVMRGERLFQMRLLAKRDAEIRD